MLNDKPTNEIGLEVQLFISGHSARTDTAVDNLKALLNETLPNAFKLTIIDVLEDPQAAEVAFVLATPTLIKIAPLPVRRAIGDLSDRLSLLRSLDLPDTVVRDNNQYGT